MAPLGGAEIPGGLDAPKIYAIPFSSIYKLCAASK